VAKDPRDEGTLVLAQTKANLGAPRPSVRWRLEDNGYGIPVLHWLNECSLTAHDLVAQPEKRRDLAVSEAEDFLRSVLSDGPVPANTVYAAAKAQGIARRTLIRAKPRTGVVTTKPGASWYWELPG
jgi:putative DNA primase/helicase